ncbi:hypothetical protein HDU98_007822 [Podochytrium sp. JEL0797]|nr:hypothetical protein HDU98_007822 [Podochytrium sp. JEL0797]
MTQAFLALPGFIVYSNLNSFDGSIAIEVTSADAALAWIGAVSPREVLAARKAAGLADDAEGFTKLVKSALAGELDEKGRQTECAVHAERVELKVFNKGAADLEFEILSIDLKSHHDPYHKVSTRLLSHLIETRTQMNSKMNQLESSQAILQRDLNLSKQSLLEWSEKKERNELDTFSNVT